MKFLGYTKEKQKADAAEKQKTAGPEALSLLKRK
jgi:hypothetical protein